MKALNINLNTCLMRPLAAAFVAVLVLSGCATRDKDGLADGTKLTRKAPVNLYIHRPAACL